MVRFQAKKTSSQEYERDEFFELEEEEGESKVKGSEATLLYIILKIIEFEPSLT